jgi:hypothetical protein
LSVPDLPQCGQRNRFNEKARRPGRFHPSQNAALRGREVSSYPEPTTRPRPRVENNRRRRTNQRRCEDQRRCAARTSGGVRRALGSDRIIL